jgi:hypothetical protein
MTGGRGTVKTLLMVIGALSVIVAVGGFIAYCVYFAKHNDDHILTTE